LSRLIAYAIVRSVMNFVRHRFPEFFRFAALIALWAMLVPVGVDAVHVRMAMSMPAHGMAMHDCGGMSRADNRDSKQPSHHLPSCPICKSLSLLGSGFAPAALVLSVAPSLAGPFYRAAKYEFLAKLLIPPQSRPRAPPANA
jgi:hypothetical protein